MNTKAVAAICFFTLITLDAYASRSTGNTPHGIANCIAEVACPSGYAGSKTYTASFRYPTNVGSPSDFCSWTDPTPRTIGRWVLQSNTCTPTAPSYKSTQTETQSLKCPAAQPSGVWTQKRTYQLWSDGSKRNYSAWTDLTKTCAAIKQSIQTENRTVACAVGETGSISQKQTHEIWTDGSKRNYSGWVNVSSTCKLIPTQVTESKDGSQEQSCDEYYNVPKGTYSGTVYKAGAYVTTYSSNSKASDTKFTVKSIDATACVAQITDVVQEKKTDPCPAGYTGSIEYYRIKAKDTKGVETFPYGESWIVSNSNCATVQPDYTPIDSSPVAPNGLLSNISLTSSSLQDGEAFSKYLNTLATSNWSANERHKLIVNIDDMSSGKYSAAKIGAAISKFQSVVGKANADVEVVMPRAIDKYIGIGGITANAVASRTVMMKDVSFDGVNAVLTYLEFSKKLTEKPKEKIVVINIIPASLGLKGVFSN